VAAVIVNQWREEKKPGEKTAFDLTNYNTENAQSSKRAFKCADWHINSIGYFSLCELGGWKYKICTRDEAKACIADMHEDGHGRWYMDRITAADYLHSRTPQAIVTCLEMIERYAALMDNLDDKEKAKAIGKELFDLMQAVHKQAKLVDQVVKAEREVRYSENNTVA